MIVEDSENWQSLLPILFEDEGVEAIVVDSAEKARIALEEGGFTEIITDGLEGEWTDVVDNAGDVPVRLLSGDGRDKKLAESKGIPFFNKADLDIDGLVKQHEPKNL